MKALELMTATPVPFDPNAPLPDLHIQARSWEPAARRFRDLTPEERAENEKEQQ